MDFHSLPRRELQALCKKNRIPANMTNVAMADALRALKSVEGVDEHQSAAAAAETTAQFVSPQKPDARISSRKMSAASVEPKEQQASPLPRARRVTFKSSEIMNLVAEGEGDKVEEKDLGAEQIVPPAPAAPVMREMTSRTTRRRASKKEEAKEEGGDDDVEAITHKTPVTRNGGRRTITRRAAATSAPVEEGKEEQVVAPSQIEEKDLGAEKVVRPAPAAPIMQEMTSRTTRRRASKKEEAKGEGGEDAVEAITNKTPVTRNGGRRTTTRKAVATSASVEEGEEEQMLAPSRTARRTKQASKTPAGDSVAASAPLGRSTRAKGTVSKMSPLAPEEASQEEKVVEAMDLLDSETRWQELHVVQEKNSSDTEIWPSVTVNVNQILGDVEDGKLMKEASEQQDEVVEAMDSLDSDMKLQELDVVQEKNDTCASITVNVNQILGEVEDDKLIEEASEQQDKGVEFKEFQNEGDDALALPDNKSSEEVLQENVGETGEICSHDFAEKGVAEVETICQEEGKNNQSDSSLSGLDGSPVIGLISSIEDIVINGEVAEKQSVHDEDKSLLQETKDADGDLVVVQEVEGENLPLENFVINEDVAGPLVAEEAEGGNACLEVESGEDLSSILVEGSGESPSSQDTDSSADNDSSEILAEVEELIGGKNPTDFEFMHDSDVTTESTGEMLAAKVDMIKEYAEPSPSEKLDEVHAEAESTTKRHCFSFAEEEIDSICANYSTKIQESDVNKENMTGILVGVEDYKVKVDNESDKQNIDLNNCSLRKLKSLLREKINNNNQKMERKRSALAQINENCLQRAS